MRKIFLWFTLLSLVMIPCAAFGLNTNPFSEFELHRDYATNKSVNIFSGQDPYYGNVTEYVSEPYEAFFAGKISGVQKGIKLPLGTLSLAEDGEYSGAHYQLDSHWDEKVSFDNGEFVQYHCGVYNSEFEGKKFTYNLATSPDIIVGSFTVPLSTDVISKSLAADEVVPFVKLISKDVEVEEIRGFDQNGNEIKETVQRNVIKQIEISFVKFGDWNTPIASPSVTDARVFIEGRYYHEEESDEIKGTKVIDFSEHNDYFVEDLYQVRLEFFRDGDHYVWRFLNGVDSESINFGDLALDKMPLKLSEDDTKEFTIELPSNFDIPEKSAEGDYPGMISTVNDQILLVDPGTIEFVKGDKTTPTKLSFQVEAVGEGRTTLILDLNFARAGRFVREVQVGTVSESGINSTGLKPTVRNVNTLVRQVNGKPIYETAEIKNINFALTGYEPEYDEEGNEIDPVHDGFFGIKSGTKTQIFRINRWGNQSDFMWEGGESVRFDTADSKYNKDYVEGLDVDGLSNATMWWEFFRHDENSTTQYKTLALKAAKFEFGNTYLTAEQQTALFVPYVEEGKWYFGKFSNGKITKLTSLPEGVSGVRVNDQEIPEGTLEGEDDHIGRFEYNYKGVHYDFRYDWLPHGGLFERENYENLIKTGDSLTVSGTLRRYNELESISVLVDNEGIVTVTPTSITPADKISFTVKGAKEGRTEVYLIFKAKDGSGLEGNFGDGKFFQQDFDYRVGSSSAGAEDFDIKSSDLTVKAIRARTLVGYIAGNEPYYYTRKGDDKKSVSFEFERKDLIQDDFRAMEEAGLLNGKVYMYKNGTIIDSSDIYGSGEPVEKLETITETDEEGNEHSHKEWIFEGWKIRFETDYIELGDQIKWEFKSGINKSGSYTITAKDVLSRNEQKKAEHPYVKLSREGLNVRSFEWYFVDSNDNKVASPTGITNISVDVYADGISEYDEETNEEKYETAFEAIRYKTSGTFAINLPSNALDRIEIEYERNGILYYTRLQPIGENWSTTSVDIFTWDTASNDLPLVMYVGDSKTLTLKAASMDSPVPFVGDSNIATVETISSSGKFVKVKVTAVAAGMTTLTLGSSTSEQVAVPREIWVAAKNATSGKYEVPHLTADVETLMTELNGGKTFVYNGSDATSTNNQPSSGTTTEEEEVTNREVTPEIAKIESPDLDLSSADVVENVKKELAFASDELSEILYKSPDIKVVSFNNPAYVAVSKDEDLSEADKAKLLEDAKKAVSSGQQLGKALPRMRILQPVIIVLKISLSNLDSGMLLFWHPVKLGTSSSSVEASAEGENNAVFLDSEGNNIWDESKNGYMLPESKDVQVAAYLEAGEYAPIITTEAAGTKRGSSTEGDNATTIRHSGGGCDAGFSIAALVLGLCFIKRRS